jgi:hypothetical protein
MYDYCGKHLKPPIQGGSYHYCPICRIVELDKRIAELEAELKQLKKPDMRILYRFETGYKEGRREGMEQAAEFIRDYFKDEYISPGSLIPISKALADAILNKR